MPLLVLRGRNNAVIKGDGDAFSYRAEGVRIIDGEGDIGEKYLPSSRRRRHTDRAITGALSRVKGSDVAGVELSPKASTTVIRRRAL